MFKSASSILADFSGASEMRILGSMLEEETVTVHFQKI
jgi:hypothetical protein